MDRKALAYSGVLLLSLVIVSIMLNRGLVQAVLQPADTTLVTTSTPTQIGQAREIHAEIAFPSFEEATVSAFELVIKQTSSTPTTTVRVLLPLDFSTSTTSTTLSLGTQPVGFPAIIQGTVQVDWQFIDVVPFDAGGTLPGSTIPGSGGNFKGVQPGAKIVYWIRWIVPNDPFFAGDYTSELVVHAGPGVQHVIPSTPATWQVVAPSGPSVENQARLQPNRDTDFRAVAELWVDQFVVAGTTSTTTTINGVDAFTAILSFGNTTDT